VAPACGEEVEEVGDLLLGLLDQVRAGGGLGVFDFLGLLSVAGGLSGEVGMWLALDCSLRGGDMGLGAAG
jgi:hypothetical protein